MKTVQLRYQEITGGRYLSHYACKRKSSLPENYGAPYHCAAGIPRDTKMQGVDGKAYNVFDGGVLAICAHSGMNQPGADGKRRVHWGNCESTCSYPPNQASTDPRNAASIERRESSNS